MKNKRGFNNFVIGIVVVVILAAIIFSTNSTSTGQATLTTGANYGTIQKEHKQVDCVYIGEDDGWSVLQAETVEYYDKNIQQRQTKSDHCESDNMARTLREYDCDKYGYVKHRLVNCPQGTECKNGACI